MGWDEPKPAEGVIIPNDGRVLFLLVIIALLLCCFLLIFYCGEKKLYTGIFAYISVF